MQTGLTGDIKNTQVGRSVDVDALTGGWWRQRERTPVVHAEAQSLPGQHGS